MKKLIYTVLFGILLVVLGNNVFANDSSITHKKVVSMVFDDSGSMAGEKEEYANYALQAMISMLDKSDKLNIVLMSDPKSVNEINLSTSSDKQQAITTVSKINSTAGTPFEAVNTARDWLVQEKNIVQGGAEYWFVIVTDGRFDTAVDMSKYMKSITNSFKGLRFNAILVGIGKDVSTTHLESFAKVANCTSQKIDTPDKIIPTMFEISSRINSGDDTQVVNATKIGDNQITVDLSIPITKMNIFIQKNNLKVSSIENNKGESIALDTYYISTDSKNAKMCEVLTASGYLKSGKYTITFDGSINLNETQIKLFVRPAVRNEMKLYKKDEMGYTVLQEEDYFTLGDKDVLVAKSKLVSTIDGSVLDLNSLEQVTGNYYINGEQINGRIEGKEFVANINLKLGNNEIYSLINADGYVKEKSNTEIINVINIDNIQIQYNNAEEYVISGTVELPDREDVTNITLKNLPDGVVVEYDGTNYKNNEKIILSENNKLIVKANKNYREENFNIIDIIANESGTFKDTQDNTYFFKISPKGVIYSVVKVDETQDTIDLDAGMAKFKIEYEEYGNIKQLDAHGIKKAKVFDVSNGYMLRIDVNDEEDILEVKVYPTILSIFNDRTVKFKINAHIKDELGIALGEFEFQIVNLNLLKVLLPYIIALIIVAIILGYMFKNRFNKKAYFKISTEEQPYLIKDYTTGIRKYLPFVSNVAILPDLEVKARSGNKIQILSTTEEIVEVNGDIEIPKNIILNLNSGEIVLKVNNKNIKYEYITLTTDEIIEELESSSKDEEYWI